MKKLCYAITMAAAVACLSITASADSKVSSVVESYEMNAENSYRI